MIRFLRHLFDLREGEGLKASLMFGYGMLLISTVIILKSVSNSLFIESQGAGKLPYVFMLVALLSALVAAIYSRYSKRIRLSRLIMVSFVFSIACLVVFWLLFCFPDSQGWLSYAFYTWVVIFSVITGSQFWFLANDIYNAREARRIFGFIGAGSIIGGICGGILTNILASSLGTRNLILIAVGFLFACMLLVTRIRRLRAHDPHQRRQRSRGRAEKAKTTENPLKLILDSRHLTYLAGIICVGVLVANLADYQYRVLAERTFVDSDALTGFFGLMQSLVNFAALAIQLFFTSRVMKHLGVTASLFFLPLGLLAGAFGILISPTLWSAILIKLSDGGFKHSINRAGMELLYLPIPSETKKRAKTFIDVFLKNFAKGVAGLTLIGLTVWLSLTLQHISLVLIVLISCWCVLLLRVKREYVDSFRHAIEKRTIDLEEQSLNLEDASLLSGFIKVLEGSSERQTLYILGLLENVKNKELVPHLERLIHHPSPEVRAVVLSMALMYPEVDLSAVARELMEDDNIDLQREAISYLYQSSRDKIAAIKEFLGHTNPRIQVAAVLCAAREWKESKDFRKEIEFKEILNTLLQSSGEGGEKDEQQKFIRIQVAGAIGLAGDSELNGFLHSLLQDEDPEVKKAAVGSVGLSPDPEFLPFLFENLNTRYLRISVRECLAGYGESVIDPLADLLMDEQQDRRKRLAVPPVLALIGSQRSVDQLWKQLEHRDLAFRSQNIRSLNRLRVGFPNLKFDPQLIKARIFDEIDFYGLMLQSWMQQNLTVNQKPTGPNKENGSRHKSRLLLVLAMEERLGDCLERIFRLLGLRYSPKDMLHAYLGLTSNVSRLRANAIEFLDNVLDSDLKKSLNLESDKTRDNLREWHPSLHQTRHPRKRGPKQKFTVAQKRIANEIVKETSERMADQLLPVVRSKLEWEPGSTQA
ncbi:MAG: MFS transporter, partial [Candidatus Aminicenantaceae bacterium]